MGKFAVQLGLCVESGYETSVRIGDLMPALKAGFVLGQMHQSFPRGPKTSSTCCL